MKLRAVLLFMALVIWSAAPNPAFAKVKDSILVRLVVGWSPIQMVVLGQLTEIKTGPAIVIEKSYLGHLKAGDLLPLRSKRALGWCANPNRVDGGKAPERRFVIFLNPSDHPRSSGRALNEAWRLDAMVSKCIVGEQVYTWMGGVPEPFEGVAGLEQRIEAGVVARKQWQKAWRISDTTARLALQWPFFMPADDSFIAHYDAMSLLSKALNRLDRTDPETRRFVGRLLALPHFQDSYAAHGHLRNFGKIARNKLQAFLAQS